MDKKLFAWSPCSGWLCLASQVQSAVQINFFTHKGVRLEDVVVQRKSSASAIAWHPLDVLVAIAWTDGLLAILSPETSIEFNVDEELKSKVTFLQWSADGKWLWAVLEDGKCIVYKLVTNSSTEKCGECSVGDKPTAACKRVKATQPGQLTGEDGRALSQTPKEETLDYRIDFLAYYDQKALLIALTSDMMLYHLTIMPDSTAVEKLKVKLNGKGNPAIVLRENLLLICHQERDLRVGVLETEENGTISLQPSKGFEADDVILCVDYSKRKGMISAGTTKGKVANWKRRPGESSVENTWRLQTGNQLAGKITSIEWCPMYSALAVNTDDELTILQEENSIICLRNKIAAIQSGTSSFVLVNVTSAVHQDLKLNITARGIYVQEKQLVVWSEDMVMTYDVQTSLAAIPSSAFSCRAEDVVIFNQTLYCIEGDKINVRTLQGTVRQILSLPEMEGDPVHFHSSRHWLAVATSAGFLRIYNIGGKEARQEHHSKYVVEALDEFYRFLSVKVNVAGNRIACAYYATPTKIGDKIVVWDAEGDLIVHFSFTMGMTDQQQYEAEAELASSQGRPVTAAARKMGREQTRFRLPMHEPGPIFWDETDDRFLVCHAQASSQHVVDDMILTMFVTSDHGIQMQDLSRKSHACDLLVGVSVPHLYFTKKMEFEEEEVRGEKSIGRYLIARSLREFSGVESCDQSTRKGMMDFCYYLTIGQMDEAFKAIRFIKSESVWEHMASMSVKTRRLDVAVVCLGNMKNIRGARALRKSQEAGESEALQCAALAVELGMLDEAEAIYVNAGRYDMAFEVASRHDRIHLRNTHYNYAKYLERAGALEPTIEKELHAWWARYLESIGELDGAMVSYSAAKDVMSLVRIKCTQGKLDEAANLALESNDRAACFHLARIYEAEENYTKAVDFYTRAHAYNSAIRLVKEHDMRDLLANLCLMAGGSEIVEAARYFEDIPGYVHQAVMLYHKAGMVGRALDLAFRAEQFSALDLVIKDLNAGSDPNVLKRAAEFFANNQNYEKAVELLCMAKEFNAAIEVCRTRNVRLTDKVSELMTPTKETTPNEAERKRLLESIAELGVQQGNYQFAAKKFTQAGDKLQAMRALLKSGDTQKIVFFANTARNKEIYILAANYLQTTDWQGNAQVIREIETFYSKAHSHLHLANFYKACAFVNINDFSKAAEALEHAETTIDRGLQEASSGTTSSSTIAGLNALKEEIAGHLSQLAKFEKIKEVYATDENDAVLQPQTLVENASEDSIIRPRHIYGLLIAHHAGKHNYRPAYRCIQQLQKLQKNLDLTTIIDAELLDKICDELQVPRVTSQQKEVDSDNEVEGVEYSHAMKKREALF
ncbi:tetratricopeptide repeat protein [Ostertagia ostertagi]